jgi:hypothetical protein
MPRKLKQKQKQRQSVNVKIHIDNSGRKKGKGKSKPRQAQAQAQTQARPQILYVNNSLPSAIAREPPPPIYAPVPPIAPPRLGGGGGYVPPPENAMQNIMNESFETAVEEIPIHTDAVEDIHNNAGGYKETDINGSLYRAPRNPDYVPPIGYFWNFETGRQNKRATRTLLQQQVSDSYF